MKRQPCQAVQYQDQMHCSECDLVWDANDPFPPSCGVRNNIFVDMTVGAALFVLGLIVGWYFL